MTIANTGFGGLRALERVNDLLRPMARGLQFGRDESSGHTVARVVDTRTQAVLRQISSDDARALAAALDRVCGALVSIEV